METGVYINVSSSPLWHGLITPVPIKNIIRKLVFRYHKRQPVYGEFISNLLFEIIPLGA
jgi:hypothetical protein